MSNHLVTPQHPRQIHGTTTATEEADDTTIADGMEAAGAATPALKPLSGRSGAMDLLTHARAVVEPTLRSAVAALPEEIERIAAYHFGWAARDGSPCGEESAWGKGVRPALVLACARAVDGRESEAVPAAAAVELVHQASVIQDDLLDADTVRRHRTTVWAAFDTPAAILVGDALFFAAVRSLHAGSSPHRLSATELLIDAVQQLVAGEYADTCFETRQEVPLPECLAMTAAKTGALVQAACSLGALYGGAAPDRVQAMGRFGHHLGVAFQAIDDYLGIWGGTATGKPVLADLRRRKRSLPVVHAMSSKTPAAEELAELYRGTDELTTAQVQRAAALIEQTGARGWAHDFGRSQLAQAHEYLERARPSAEGLAQLTTLARLICDREA